MYSVTDFFPLLSIILFLLCPTFSIGLSIISCFSSGMPITVALYCLIISQFLGLESEHGLTGIYLCLSLSESYSQISAEAGSISSSLSGYWQFFTGYWKKGLNSLQAAWPTVFIQSFSTRAFPPRQLASSKPARESTRKTEVTTFVM